MKIRFVTILFLFFSSICQAKYSPLMLSQLIDDAKLIGNVEIIKIDEKQIIVKFLEFFKGSSKNKILKINKFENWTCSTRWTTYRIGQKELIFLKYSKNKELMILGSGNEGEMPIHNNQLYYKSPFGYFDKNAKIYKFNKQEVSAYLFTMNETKEGIQKYIENRNKFHDMGKDKSTKFKELKNKFLTRLVFELRTEIYMTEN